MEYATTNKDGYGEYKSDKKECKKCPYLEQCTKSRKNKIIARHLCEGSLERAKENRYTEEGKILYSRRKETIERTFAEGKEKHGMRFTRHKGKTKVEVQFLLTLTVLNLKKLANML